MAINPEGWSAHNPNMKIAWGSSSLSNFQACPQYYKYVNLDGYKTPKVDLEFGGYAASSFEVFQKARVAGQSRDMATMAALRYVLTATWDAQTSQPWGGRIEELWHCEGTTKYRNSKGNAAKCPYAHKGAFFPAPAPHICGECGSAIQTGRQYIPDHKTKNRETLVRLVVWYCLDQPEDMQDGLHPYVFPDGTAAIELSFALPLPWKNRYGETYILAGHLDQIGDFGGELFVTDQKTTTKALDKKYFMGHSPSIQFDTYDMVSKVLFPDLDIKGVLCDAAQTSVEGTRFARYPYYRTDAQREEHMELIKFWIDLAEDIAERYGDGDWPRNKKSCYLCPFKEICSMDPAQRARALATLPKGDRWDDLHVR